MTSSKEDTADLLQDVFLKAFRSMETFKGQSKFYTWLYRIAINRTLDFLDSRKRKPTYSLETWGEGGNVAEFLMPGESVPAADRAVLLKELQEKLNEALQKLSHNHRTVVVLFEIEGMSHAEIAKTLQCSEGTVRSRLHYAKEQLKQSLSRYLKDHGGTTEV
jgi:RNA polymerase sigma-70 factor (ECF subfamily)